MLVLTVIQGPDKGRRFELPAHEPQLLGRSSEALPIDDSAISRRHAELTPDSGEWYLRDLQSQNGTYVNGVRLGERTRLRVGDQIRVGQTLLVFGRSEGPDPDMVRVLGPRHIDSSVEHALPSTPLSEPMFQGNEDSVILAVPEPRAAAPDHLRVIYRLSQLLSSQVLDRQQLLGRVMDLIFAEFTPERGCLMLRPAGDAGPAPTSSLSPAVVRHKLPPRDDEKLSGL